MASKMLPKRAKKTYFVIFLTIWYGKTHPLPTSRPLAQADLRHANRHGAGDSLAKRLCERLAHGRTSDGDLAIHARRANEYRPPGEMHPRVWDAEDIVRFSLNALPSHRRPSHERV